GHPQGLWSTEEVLEHLGSVRGTPVTADDALDALAVLHNYSLVTLTETADREVTLHALTARAAMNLGPETHLAVLTAAGALHELWPCADFDAMDLAAALRANTDVLTGHDVTHLIHPWPGIHALLFRYRTSLIQAGLYTSSVQYWSSLAASGERILGDDHPDVLTSRLNLAQSYSKIGDIDNAIRLAEQAHADHQDWFGYDAPDTLMARSDLAAIYWKAGRADEAISLPEEVLADRQRVLGDDHPDTVVARNNLGATYSETGRIDEAIGLQEQVLADRQRVLGDDHPSTLIACNNLGATYWYAGLEEKAAEMLHKAVTGFDRVLGPDHPDSEQARENLITFTRESQPDAAHDSSTRSPSSEGEPGSAL
ncbi:tetratricopeptide repeat protein, partial [Kitasatospora sp. NPDC001225]